MTFSQWLFGGIDNPYYAGQWGVLHISVMLCCVALILTFNFVAKKSHQPERAKKVIVYVLVGVTAFFEIMLRFMYYMKLYYFHQPVMEGVTALEIALPKPWCQISSWALMIAVLAKKPFLYNFASLSSLLCAVVFFIYPGVGFNNVYLLFENWYSICTHALLLTTSITLMCFKYADFRYKWLWKVMLCFLLTIVYGLLQVFVLKIHADPLYFMPGGDIQAGILKIDYDLYLFGYITVILLYINTAHMLGDKETVRRFFAERKWMPIAKTEGKHNDTNSQMQEESRSQ